MVLGGPWASREVRHGQGGPYPRAVLNFSLALLAPGNADQLHRLHLCSSSDCAPASCRSGQASSCPDGAGVPSGRDLSWTLVAVGSLHGKE